MLRIAFEGEPEDATLAGVAAGVGPRLVRSDRELAATRDTLSAYLEGDDDTLGLPVDLSLARGPFRRAVLDTLHREVHRGEVVTYGELAAAGRQPARGARGRQRLRHQPRPDRRTLPPRAAGLPQARQLRRRARAQARAAHARRRALEGLSRYAALLRLPEARAPLIASALGALPIGMFGLAILLLARDTTGSFASAGRVVAAFGLANALGAVAQGRLMDRLGQTRVLRVAAVDPRRRARRARAGRRARRVRARARASAALVAGCLTPPAAGRHALAVGHARAGRGAAAAPPTRSSRSCSRCR